MHRRVRQFAAIQRGLTRLGVAAAIGTGWVSIHAQDQISYNRDIRPLLSQNCFSCHGADEGAREANLRLDNFESATSPSRKGRTAIAPGSLENSQMVARIFSDDPDEIMPPPDSGRKLNEGQKQLLSRWIESGANYEQHWAFVPPNRPTPPEESLKSDWPQNELDQFILSRMQDHGLKPSPEAEAATLFRRVALDLTGLPPEPAELEAAINSEDPFAYEHWVDRLLQKPEFGERWASVWLDLARYADSAGYGSDPLRDIWRYRDWVIQALNSNMPFDEFTIQQIAGDLLPDATEDQILATAFHRNTKTNTEGGTDDEEFRVEAVRDRINTTMQVWMGLTFGCAQCHTHKYDPISHKEYYQMYGYFNQTADNDRPSEEPRISTPTPENLIRLAELHAQADVVAEFETASNEVWSQWQEQWESTLKSSGPTGGVVLSDWRWAGPFEAENFDEAFKKDSELAELSNFSELVDASTQDLESTDGAVILFKDPRENSAVYLTRTVHSWTTRPVEFSLGSDDGIQFWLNDERLVSNKTSRAAEPDQEKARGMLKPGDNKVVLKIVNGGGPSGFYFNITSTWPEGEIGDILSMDSLDRIEEQKDKLARYYRTLSPALREEQRQLAQARQTAKSYENSMPRTPIMKELPEDDRRKTFIMIAGSFLNPGDPVEAAPLGSFHPMPEDAPNNRLGLARWLVDRRNPLTARVTVNRFWSRLFGEGIVSTEEDFGSQGELPTHPLALDWLAVDFMESGWNVKELLKTLVTSSTYRQSSKVTDEHLEKDPDNRWLARAPRFRLPAESLRDQALNLAGLLTPKMYGESVFPPQPPNMWQAAFNGQRNWATDTDEDRFRRGVYVFLRRTVPYPGLATFDAPSREVCTLRRIRTNTPLQAFVTLNDPGFFEAAQGLAKRIVREMEGDVSNRVATGYQWVTGGAAEAEEVQALVELFEAELEWYEQHPEDAKKLSNNPLTGPMPAQCSEAELAAWTVVTNVLLNLDRFFMKG